jgi:hypothetical protein
MALVNLLTSDCKMLPSEAWDLTSHLTEWVVETNDAFIETKLSMSMGVMNLFSSVEDEKERVRLLR